MPSIAKILSDEEHEKLELTQVEEISPEFVQDFGNQEELDQVLFRIMKPHAFVARNEYLKRKQEQERHKKWLDTITNGQLNLRVTQDLVKELANKSRNQNGNGNGAGGLGGR